MPSRVKPSGQTSSVLPAAPKRYCTSDCGDSGAAAQTEAVFLPVAQENSVTSSLPQRPSARTTPAPGNSKNTTARAARAARAAGRCPPNAHLHDMSLPSVNPCNCASGRQPSCDDRVRYIHVFTRYFSQFRIRPQPGSGNRSRNKTSTFSVRYRIILNIC